MQPNLYTKILKSNIKLVEFTYPFKYNNHMPKRYWQMRPAQKSTTLLQAAVKVMQA